MTGAFRDKDVERRFRCAHRQESIVQARLLFAFGAMASAVILAVALTLGQDGGTAQTVTRLGVIAMSLAGYALVGRVGPGRVEPLIFCWQAAVTLSAAIFAGTQSNAALVAVFLVPVVFYLAVPVALPTAAATGLAASITLLVAYAGTTVDYHDVGIAMALLVANGTLWLTAVRTERARRLEWAVLEAHQRTLADLADSRAVLERTFAAVPVPLIVTAMESGKIVRANEAAEKFVGVGPGELVGRRSMEFYANPLDRAAFLAGVRGSELVKDVPFSIVTAHDRRRSVLLSSCLVTGGGADHLVTSVIDMTDRERREERLRAAEAEYRALFENAVVGIYRSTPEGRMLRANPALVRLNGYDSESELITAVADIAQEWYIHPHRREEWKQLMREQGKVTDFVSEVYRHKNRERIWISENGWTKFGPDGEPEYYEGTVIEATERMRAEAETAYLARYDALTDLANRTLLKERLDEAAACIARQGGRFAVFCLDLDRFKPVNDAFGHAAGDLLLQGAARRLKEACRLGDTVARLGGDEFVIVQVGFHDPADLREVAGRIIRAFEQPFDLDGARARVGVSIGIAVAPEDGNDPQELLKNADDALYQAKQAGRNRCRFFNLELEAPQPPVLRLPARRSG